MLFRSDTVKGTTMTTPRASVRLQIAKVVLRARLRYLIDTAARTDHESFTFRRERLALTFLNNLLEADWHERLMDIAARTEFPEESTLIFEDEDEKGKK